MDGIEVESRQSTKETKRLTTRMLILVVAVCSAVIGSLVALGVVGMAAHFDRRPVRVLIPSQPQSSEGLYPLVAYQGSSDAVVRSEMELTAIVRRTRRPRAGVVRDKVVSTARRAAGRTWTWLRELGDELRRAPAEYLNTSTPPPLYE